MAKPILLLCLCFHIWLKTACGFNSTNEDNFCFSSLPKWSVGNGDVLLNGNHAFHVKGINWFGMETDSQAPHGLNMFPLDNFIKILSTHKFNCLRLPFSVINVLKNPTDLDVSCEHNPKLCKLPYLDLIDQLIVELGKQGILVLLDQHRIYGTGDQAIHELWYEEPRFPEDKIVESWEILLSKIGRKWNILGLDLKNEPHGAASWGSGNVSSDWNLAAPRLIRHIVRKFPVFRGLFFIQGVQDKSSTLTPNVFPHFWGGNLEGMHKHPISTGYSQLDDRIVYSPHTYGPDVWMQAYFESPNFPEDLKNVWNLHFGFVEKLTSHPVVIGEWGGQYWPGTKDKEWADALAEFLLENCMSDNFYWCLNPNAFSTGGILLDDWKTARTDKLTLLQKIQPDPSQLMLKRRMYCFYPGSLANKKCGKPNEKIPKPEENSPSSAMGTPVILSNTKGNKQPVYVRPRPESEESFVVVKDARPQTPLVPQQIQPIQIPNSSPRPVVQKWVIPKISPQPTVPQPNLAPRPNRVKIIHTMEPEPTLPPQGTSNSGIVYINSHPAPKANLESSRPGAIGSNLPNTPNSQIVYINSQAAPKENPEFPSAGSMGSWQPDPNSQIAHMNSISGAAATASLESWRHGTIGSRQPDSPNSQIGYINSQAAPNKNPEFPSPGSMGSRQPDPYSQIAYMNSISGPQENPRFPSPDPQRVIKPPNLKTELIQHMSLALQAERVNVWETFWPETSPLSELKIVIQNIGQSRVCDAEISLGDTAVKGQWNVYPEPEKPGTFSFPKWLKLYPGESYDGMGMIIYGKQFPEIKILNVWNC